MKDITMIIIMFLIFCLLIKVIDVVKYYIQVRYDSECRKENIDKE